MAGKRSPWGKPTGDKDGGGNTPNEEEGATPAPLTQGTCLGD